MFLCVVTKLREAIQNPPRVSVTRHFSSKVYRPFPSFRRLQHKYGLYVQFFFCYVNFTFSHFSPLILPLTTLRYRFCCSWLCGLFYFSVRLCLIFNPLKPELNPICYLLALLAHHFLHVSRIRVKSLTIRLLMSYTYGTPILDVSRSHTTTQHSR